MKLANDEDDEERRRRASSGDLDALWDIDWTAAWNSAVLSTPISHNPPLAEPATEDHGAVRAGLVSFD